MGIPVYQLIDTLVEGAYGTPKLNTNNVDLEKFTISCEYEFIVNQQHLIAEPEEVTGGNITEIVNVTTEGTKELYGLLEYRLGKNRVDALVMKVMSGTDEDAEGVVKEFLEMASFGDEREAFAMQALDLISPADVIGCFQKANAYWNSKITVHDDGKTYVEGFDMSNEKVARLFREYMGISPYTLSTYHKEEKDYNHWYVENDPTVDFTTGKVGLPIEITAAINRGEAAMYDIRRMLEFIRTYGYTNDTTGLHINIGFAEDTPVDELKLVLLFGETDILRRFNRVDNQYAESHIKNMIHFADSRLIQSILNKLKSGQQLTLTDTAALVNNEKYFSISTRHGSWYEIRAPGNTDYEKKWNQIRYTITRAAAALQAAADKTANVKEYAKALNYLLVAKAASESKMPFDYEMAYKLALRADSTLARRQFENYRNAPWTFLWPKMEDMAPREQAAFKSYLSKVWTQATQANREQMKMKFRNELVQLGILEGIKIIEKPKYIRKGPIKFIVYGQVHEAPAWVYEIKTEPAQEKKLEVYVLKFGSGWRGGEVSTGLNLATGRTRAEALKNAVDQIVNVGWDRIIAAMQNAPHVLAGQT